MKSPTNQDFIDENQEEGIEIQRKIRVKILDPDATDSSSDDEQEKRPKFIIHEIIQEKVKIQSFPQNNNDPFDFYQFSGKLPPIIRKKIAAEEKLKVVSSAKEAISAKSEVVVVHTSDSSKVKNLSDQFSGKLPPMVRKRKCGKFAAEFEEKLKVAKNVIVEKAISAESEIGCSSSDPPLMVDTGFDQLFGKLPPMVRKRKTGKFSAEIRHPFSKKRIWLGTFDTSEEASEVYQSKKLEFEKLKKGRNAKLQKVISAIEAYEFSQYKEFEKKKLKKAKNANVKKVISAKFELGVSSSDPPLMVDSQSSDSSKVKIQSFSLNQISGKLPPMVRKRKSGKFATEIKHPITKKRIWLGTFDTAEEASEVYQSKKLEFEKLKKANNANVKKAISAKFEAESFSSDPPLMVHSQSSGSLNELVDQMRKARNGNVKAVIFAKSEFGCSSDSLIVDSQTSDSPNESDERLNMAINAKEKRVISAKSEHVSSSSGDQPLVVDSQTSDSSNGQESEEEIWTGQWIRVSGDKEVKFSMKLGVPVVDNYGFLLGEFSELDDLSISI